MCATFALLALMLVGSGDGARFEQLDNGLRMVVIPEPTYPLVSVQLWYGVGSGGDPPSRLGRCALARALIEQNHKADTRLRALGAAVASETWPDATAFAAVVPSGYFEAVMRIQAERAQLPKLDQTQLARARASAMRRTAARAPSSARRAALRSLYPDHPYGRSSGIVTAGVRDIDPPALQEFLDRWFVAGNATLVIVGAVEPLKAIQLAREHFGRLPSKAPATSARPKWLREPVSGRDVCLPDADGVTVAWRAPAFGSIENGAIDVLMHRLCNPIDGTLAASLGDTAEAAEFDWQRVGWRYGGWLVLEIRGVEAMQASTVRTLVREALESAGRKTPSPIEHNRARMLAWRSAAERLNRFRDRALALGYGEAVGGNALLGEMLPAQILQVTVGDVQRAAGSLSAAGFVTVAAGKGGDNHAAIGGMPELLRPRGDEEAIEPLGVAELAKVWQAFDELSLGESPCGEQATPDNGSIAVTTLPGAEAVAVLTLDGLTLGGWLDVGDGLCAVEGDVRSRAADYLSYRGMGLYRVAGARSGWLVVGPPVSVGAGVEWPRLLSAGQEPVRESPVIIAAGAVALEDLQQAAGLVWGDVTRPTTRPSDRDTSAGGLSRVEADALSVLLNRRIGRTLDEQTLRQVGPAVGGDRPTGGLAVAVRYAKARAWVELDGPMRIALRYAEAGGDPWTAIIDLTAEKLVERVEQQERAEGIP